MTAGVFDTCRSEALVAVASVLPGMPRDRAAEVVAAAIGSGDLCCVVMAVDGDLASGLAMEIGERSGSHLDRDTAQRLLEHVFPVDGVALLRHPVRHRTVYRGSAGAMATLSSMPQVLRSSGSGLVHVRDAEVVAAPVITDERVAAVVAAWGEATPDETERSVVAGAALLALAWGRPARRGDGPSLAVRRRGAAERALRPFLEDGRLVAAYQPIVRLHDGAVMGWEALARFTPSERIRSPEALFGAAVGAGLEADLDAACLAAAATGASNLAPAPLFLNVTLPTLLEPEARQRLDAVVASARLRPDQVVLEVSERQPVPDLERLRAVCAELRGCGYRIAVDDAGSGHASMRVVAELRPDFLKIDRSLIHEVATDRARRALVVALLSFGGQIGSHVIAEGIETDDERQTLNDLGVQYGQGWHLGRPVMIDPPPAAPDVDAVAATWFAGVNVVGFDADRRETAVPVPRPEPALRHGRGRRSLPAALSDAASVLQNEHDRERILSVIAAQLERVVPVKEICIYAADHATHRFVPLLATGPEAGSVLGDSFALDRGLTGWAFGTGVPQYVRDTSTHPMSRQIPGTAVSEESLLLLPMVAGDVKLGIINCWRRGVDRFTAADLEAAALFAHMAASAWRNAQLYTELLEAAMTDPLTGLLNSRWLHEAGAREVARHAAGGTAHAALLFDLDHFKMVNDSCGHAAGDAVLRRVARGLRGGLRRSDSVVRLGGEEFLVLLPETDADAAVRVAGALRERIAEIPVPEGCTLARLTASVGVAVRTAGGHDLEALIHAADVALYAAKAAGRDRVVVGGTDLSAGSSVPRRRGSSSSTRLDCRRAG